ncbi:MAG: hypothetical protein ACREBG_00805 [Pyrinomonadaceae bacterium]
MAEKQIPFFTQTALLDRYIHTAPTKLSTDVLKIVIKSLKTNDDLGSYFFRSQPDPTWGPVLLQHGFFTEPPKPISSEQGQLLPRWEAQEFLKSVAKQIPEVVLEHIRSIQVHPVYLERAVGVLRESSPQMAIKAVPTILNWLQDPRVAMQISLECLELVKLLADEKQADPALRLLEALTAPYPSANAKDYGEYVLNGSAICSFPIDDYNLRFFNQAVEALANLSAVRTVSILESQLCNALRLEGETEKDANYKSRSFWRSAIEDSGQDSFPEFKDVLLMGLRDALELWGRLEPAAVVQLIERYLDDDHEILRRMGFYLLQAYPDTFVRLTVRELLDRENLDNVGIHHEYFMLLQAGYQYLNYSQQRALLDLIIEGPPAETVERVAEWAQIDHKERDEYVRIYSETWVRDRLFMIENHLEGKIRSLLDDLVRKRGKPEHAAFTHWTSGGYFVSNVSPTTTAELSRKSPNELVSYLANWQPRQESLLGPERESHGALARDAAQVILSDLASYGDSILKIASMRPEYAGSFLSASSTDADPDSLWDLRLTICERLLADNGIRTDMGRSLEGGWISFRHGVGGLLEKAVSNPEPQAPEQFWPRIRDLLFLLTEDPDPDQESDRPKEGWLGHHDPLTVAINHIRSQAVISLITYAGNKASRDKRIFQDNETPERMEHEVKDVLTRKVDPLLEPSLAVHSVFGRELNLLYWLDKRWTESQLEKIFPSRDDPTSIDFFVAAWDSYVIATRQIYLELFELLRPQYERAIENVSRGYVTKTHLNPVQRLADHLLVEYLNREYDILSPFGQESLIASFFNKTRPDARAQGAWAVAQQCNQHLDRLDTFWPRSRALWNWRVNVATASNYSNDFAGEMEGFSLLLNTAWKLETIDSLWPLLEGLLPYVGRDQGWDRLWHNLQEYLAKEIDRDPIRTIKFYRLMHDKLRRPVWYDKEATKIFETAAANPESRDQAVELIDKISRSGNYQFKAILDRHVK